MSIIPRKQRGAPWGNARVWNWKLAKQKPGDKPPALGSSRSDHRRIFTIGDAASQATSHELVKPVKHRRRQADVGRTDHLSPKQMPAFQEIGDTAHAASPISG